MEMWEGDFIIISGVTFRQQSSQSLHQTATPEQKIGEIVFLNTTVLNITKDASVSMVSVETLKLPEHCGDFIYLSNAEQNILLQHPQITKMCLLQSLKYRILISYLLG